MLSETVLLLDDVGEACFAMVLRRTAMFAEKKPVR